MLRSHIRLSGQAALALSFVSVFGVAAQAPGTAPATGVVGPPAVASKANPLDTQAAVPPLRYQPAFAGYKGVLDQPVGNWKAANDLTAQSGGWRTHAKQGREADAAPMPGTADKDQKAGTPAPAAPVASMPAGHGHHKSP